MNDDKPLAWHPWFFEGMRGIFSLPALILMSAMVGFCAYAMEAGVPIAQVVFMTGAVWALPAKVILISSMTAGATLIAAFIAVSLSSIRMMPMVAALVPEIRSRRTPAWLLLMVSHFVAITAWVYTMERVRTIPREGRLPFFVGFGMTLTTANMVVVGVVSGVVGELPALVVGALFFLTPIYFITSIWASARDAVIYVAMIVGLACGPIFHEIAPEFDVLYAGIVGGTLAFFIERLWRRRRSRGGPAQ